MKIKDAIKYLSDYENQNQEIMISWNDKENMSYDDEHQISTRTWNKAVLLFDKYCGEHFHEDCNWAILEAKDN